MKVRCPACGSKGVLNAELAGHMARCSRCGGKFVAREEAWVAEGIKWYYAEGDEKRGPLGEHEFEQLIAAGTVAPDTLVWRKGMSGWQPLVAAQGEKTVAIAHETAVPAAVSSAEASRPATEAPEAVAATAAAAWAAGLVYAGGGKRLFAKIIDLIFMGAMATLVEALSRKLFPDAFVAGGNINNVYLSTMLLDMLLGMIYIVWFVGKFGATPGKMVFSLKVVTPSGGRVDYAHAFGRYWSEFVVIWLTLMLGYLPILFDSQKRGLHDRLCSTRVVQV